MLVIAVTLVPLPLLAADQVAAAPAQPLKTSIARHAAREVLVSPAKPTARSSKQAAPQSTAPHSGGFLKSPAGIAVLAVLGAGTGYAIYSASHDRIHSVARDAQK